MIKKFIVFAMFIFATSFAVSCTEDLSTNEHEEMYGIEKDEFQECDT
jgi:hypothetical protein